MSALKSPDVIGTAEDATTGVTTGPTFRIPAQRGQAAPTLTASVVICCYTFERWADVRQALGSALAQEPAPARVLVVVDHNDELLERMSDELVPEPAPGTPEVVLVPNSGTRGLSGARNTGLALVESDIVAFLDDDACAQPGWLGAHLAAYDEAGVAGVGGRLQPAWDVERPGWFPHDFDWVIGCTHTGVPVDAAEIRNPIGANMSFRTRALRRAGGFSEDLGRIGSAGAGCEETEASIRVTAQNPGSVVWYVPDAVVEHRVTRARGTWRYFRQRCVAEGRSKATVRSMSAQPLRTELGYVLGVLPGSFVTAVRDRAAGDPDGLRRAGAIGAGLGLTVYGYAAQSLADRKSPSRRGARRRRRITS